ncbi:helix-turn-helix transcriptional regulator [candidate division WWE3 bacterium]|nr:helix-turn-helix transcriptional regulator [candidate division WWE3 bacterium]
MSRTFGEYLKSKRMETNLTLRQFCRNKGLDPAYISRLENGIIAPPSKESLLKTLAKALNFSENTPEWVEFFDLASAGNGVLPADIKQEFPEVLAYLPAFLRSVKRNKVTREDVQELIQLVKGGYDGPEAE